MRGVRLAGAPGLIIAFYLNPDGLARAGLCSLDLLRRCPPTATTVLNASPAALVVAHVARVPPRRLTPRPPSFLAQVTSYLAPKQVSAAPISPRLNACCRHGLPRTRHALSCTLADLQGAPHRPLRRTPGTRSAHKTRPHTPSASIALVAGTTPARYTSGVLSPHRPGSEGKEHREHRPRRCR